MLIMQTDIQNLKIKFNNANVREEDLTNTGALIVGGEVEIYSKQDIQNIGTIRADGTVDLHGQNLNNKGEITGNNVKAEADKNITNTGSIRAKVDAILKANNITNEATAEKTQYKELNQTDIKTTGSITAGNNLTLDAKDNITNKGGVLAADGDLTLNAGQNIHITTVANEKHVAVAYGSSSAEIHSVQNQQGVVSGKNVAMNSGKDVNITGGIVTANKDTTINAGGNVNMNAVKDLYSEESEVGHRGGSYYNHNKQADETVKGTNIAGKENITINSGNDINMKGSSITSEAGKAALNAENNVNIQNETEYHERLHESYEESSGILSSKSTDIYDYSNVNTVVGSNVSAGSVDINSGKDTNVKGSNVVADKDVNIKTGGQLNVESAEQTSESEYQKTVKKSGLLSGGGLGFTIGKEKQKDQYANQNSEQVGSTIGSIKGSVNMEAEKDANIKGSNVIAKEDINITGGNVNIENSTETYNHQEKHEYKKSGLSVSIGGTTVEAAQNITNTIEHASQVQDDKLKELYALDQAYNFKKNVNNIKNTLDNVDAKDASASFKVSVGIGSTSSKTNINSSTISSKESNVTAEGDVNIKATDKDINIKGSNVSGNNVDLNAKENINITASENSNKTDVDANSKSWGASVDFGLHGIVGGNISYGKADTNVDANSTTHTNSNVTANKDMNITSGKDTNINGGKVSGDKVTADIGGNLNVESTQDKDQYTSKGSSTGINIGLDKKPQGSSLAYGDNKTDTKSDYNSVTNQSGIYAGKEGFDITVDKNTDLKGGVIDSDTTADKNHLTTGTLTWEDKDNKAEYSSTSNGKGVSVSQHQDITDKGNTKTDVMGSINSGADIEGAVSSTTKSGVAEGTITITDKENQKQNIAELNRDTKNTLNSLGKIFDAKDVAEQQELFGLLSKNLFNVIGDLGLKEGSPEKIALDAAAGAFISKLSGTDIKSGMTGAAITQLAENFLKDVKDPTVHQLLANAISGAVTKMTGGNAQTGAAMGTNEAKHNYLFHDQIKQRDKEINDAIARGASEEEIQEIKDRWNKIDAAQDEALDIYGYPAGEILEGNSSQDIEMQNNVKKYAQWILLPDSTKSALQSALGTTVSSTVTGLIDEEIEDKIRDGLQNKIKINANAQGLPYLNYVAEIAPGSNLVMKSVAKVGVLNIGKTAYSIYLNGKNYDNMSDFTKASAWDIVGLGTTAAAGIAAGAMGVPAAAIVAGGVVVGYIVDTGVANMKPVPNRNVKD